MTCHRRYRLAALAAGEDLRGRDFEAWRLHSSRCVECREAERAVREGLVALRAAAPFEFAPSERAEMRRAVWRRIDDERGRAAGRRDLAWLSLAAAAAVVVTILAPWNVLPHREAPAPHIAQAPVENAPALPATPPLIASTSEAVERLAVRPVRATHRPREAARVEGRGPSRLEIATPDPDVRIIWLYDPGEAAPDAPADAPEEAS